MWNGFILKQKKPYFLRFHFNPIQDGRRKSPLHHNSFSPVISTNVWISHQNILTFSLNPFATRNLSFKAITSVSPEILNLNQDYTEKKAVALLKSL